MLKRLLAAAVLCLSTTTSQAFIAENRLVVEPTGEGTLRLPNS